MSNERLDQAIRALNKVGGLVAMPSEWGYVIACRAADREAAERLAALPAASNNFRILIATSIDQLCDLGLIRRYLKAVEQYWPGFIGVFIPSSDHSLDYLRSSGGIVANITGGQSALATIINNCGPLLILDNNQTLSDIERLRQTYDNMVDTFIDAGKLSQTSSLTLIRVIDDAVAIVRQGAAIVPS